MTLRYDVLYSASLDGTVRATDIETGQFLCIFNVQHGGVSALTEANNLLYIGTVSGSIKVWDRMVNNVPHSINF